MIISFSEKELATVKVALEVYSKRLSSGCEDDFDMASGQGLFQPLTPLDIDDIQKKLADTTWTVLGVYPESGQIIMDHAHASSKGGENPFVMVSKQHDDVEWVVAMKGRLCEGEHVVFPGLCTVSSETILANPDSHLPNRSTAAHFLFGREVGNIDIVPSHRDLPARQLHDVVLDQVVLKDIIDGVEDDAHVAVYCRDKDGNKARITARQLKAITFNEDAKRWENTVLCWYDRGPSFEFVDFLDKKGNPL